MHLSKRAAFYLQASIFLSFLAGSSAPTPLYPVYQAAWGFSPITVTIVFGSYALAVLAALLVTGSLSDYVGRRPVLALATLLQAFTMVLFVTADDVTSLLTARVLQGLATGGAVGAVGAGLVDLDRERGPIANAVAPMLGTATGGLVSGLMVQYLPLPTKLIYGLLAAVFVAQACGALLMPETVTPRPGALGSLRPRFALPPRVREPVLLAAPVLVATWALIGFYGSLGPTLVRRLAGSSSLVLGGLLVFVFALSGAATIFITRARAPRGVMTLGTVELIAGVGLTLLAIGRGSLAGFWLGTALAGSGFGAGFQGAIRSVVSLAPAAERASVLSILYVVAYLAMGLPAVMAGFRVVHGGGLLSTAREYGLAVMLLASAALVAALAARLVRRPSLAADTY